MIPFPNKKYKIIYADPAWRFKTYSNKGKKKNPENHYVCMSMEDIKNLPVKNISDENSILFLWVIYPLLEQALEVIKEWGFTYKTCAFSWIKKKQKVR